MSTSSKKTSSKKTTKKKISKESFTPFNLTTKTVVAFLAFIIAVVSLFYYLNNESDDFVRPDYQPIATVYHSEMIGMDAGDEYIYSIFENKNSNTKSFFYIKSKARITMVGSGESRDVSSGSINNRSDLNKIVRDIDKDSSGDSKNVSYRYLINGEYTNIDTIEELGNKLFSK